MAKFGISGNFVSGLKSRDRLLCGAGEITPLAAWSLGGLVQAFSCPVFLLTRYRFT